MLQIANEVLRVDLLDPTADAHLLGPRFCAGGFIWQVHHESAGPLLSGPEGDVSRPDPFNGHGLPESFRDRSRSGEKWLWRHNEALAPGVGKLGRVEGVVAVVEPCHWHIDIQPRQASFRTRHQAAGYAVEVQRQINLSGHTLRSVSRLTNRGDSTMELEWFAHPFFALDDSDLIKVSLPTTVTIPSDSGFDLSNGMLRGSRRYIGKDDGAFTLLEGFNAIPVTANISHPKLENGIQFSTDFIPSECPIWVNGFTFSIEPYQALRLEPGESREWVLTYDFGESETGDQHSTL